MRILTGSDDKTARLWDAAGGEVVATFVGHTGSVRAVAFSPDGTRILTGSLDKTARLWSVFKSAEALVDTRPDIRAPLPDAGTTRGVPSRHATAALVLRTQSLAVHRSWPALYRRRQPSTSTNLGRTSARGLGSARFPVRRSCCKTRELIAAMFCNARTAPRRLLLSWRLYEVFR